MATVRATVSLWDRILDKLKAQINPQNFATWFRPTSFLSKDGDTLNIRVPNRMFKDWIVEEWSEELAAALQAIGTEDGVDLRSLRFNFIDAHADAEAGESERRDSVSLLSSQSRLNGRYTFESFVVGNSNQFAHAAARRVAEAPGTGYNPLFLYGGVGLGKTHLMHAIGHSILESRKNLRLTYISADRFMNELIAAIRTEKILEFRDRYRRSDVLLVDDIQFIQNKERTQDEFFHTFNHLHESGRQIVVSSDRLPDRIPTLEERLKTRFTWGLLADIQAPDLETKIAIVEKKAEADNVVLPREVALFIASRVKSNIRELEGSLIRLIAVASLTGRTIDIDLAREALADQLGTEDRPVTIERIQKYVAEIHGMKPSDLRSRTNRKAVAFPRQIAMWLSKTMTRASFPEIGREFGGKHHSTVMHSVAKIELMRKADPEFHKLLNSYTDSI